MPFRLRHLQHNLELNQGEFFIGRSAECQLALDDPLVSREHAKILVEGDKRLFNQYGVMLVNPDKHAHVKKDMGQAFVDWLISPDGQKAIAEYKINGKQLFFPNADVPGA